MNSAFLCIALLLQTAGDRSSLWRSVGQHPTPLEAGHAHLTATQERSIEATLKKGDHVWECASDDPGGEWVHGLRFEPIPLSDKHETILVEAGSGCARGGQGSNGAMWIVQLVGDDATVLASPAGDFNGWLYSVQVSTSKGYKDIVLGWHMSAREAILSYFRLEGTQYRRLSSATIRWDDSEHAIITPADKDSH